MIICSRRRQFKEIFYIMLRSTIWGKAIITQRPLVFALHFIPGLVNSVVIHDHTEINREAFVEKPSGSLKGLVDSVVINDHKNTKDDQLPEDVSRGNWLVPSMIHE